MAERYDAIVVGSGPAGLEAAINLKIRAKRFLLLGSGRMSRKISAAPIIHNYLGLPQVTGEELARRFSSHLEEMDISITEEMASTVYPMGDYFSVATSHNLYEATTVILATGAFDIRTLPGEEEFLGRGVGYCASCDALLYRGKKVAVVGYSEEAVGEANFISEVAAQTFFVPARAGLSGLRDSIQIVDGKVKEIRGSTRAEALVLEDQELCADGIFILRESVAPASLAPGIRIEQGYIWVDDSMQTSIPGCFAAGDCTGKPHQYIRAAGQGLTAAYHAVLYMDKRNRQSTRIENQ